MTTPPLRTVIAGCGNIAGGFDSARPAGELPLTHAGAFVRHGGFTLVACIEPDETRRNAFMAHWGVPLGFASLADPALRDLGIELASLCTPTRHHAADLEAALALRPRAIFCEKPVTPSVAETAHWVERCGKAGVLLAVNHTRRWAPDVRRLGEELARGDWGALRSVTGWYNKGILNNGGHLVDLIRWLAGELTLRAAGPAVHDFWPDDPTVAALLEAPGGVPVQLCTAHAGDYALFELQLVTARAVILMENGGMNWRVRTSIESPTFKGYRNLSDGQARPGEYAQAMSAAAANLHGAITAGQPLAGTGANALAAQRLCEQIRDAASQPFSTQAP